MSSPNSYQTALNPARIFSGDIPLIDTEFVILENIYDFAEQQIPLRQRELAQITGASLGMINSILKRLAKKGLITVKKLNSRNIQYAVTLEGINEIIRRSYRYFKRTIRNAVYYKDTLEDLVFRAKRRNIARVVLAGPSDLDFIVEHACHRFGLGFLKTRETSFDEKLFSGTLVIYSENIVPKKTVSHPDIFHLSRLIIRQAAGAGNGESPR